MSGIGTNANLHSTAAQQLALAKHRPRVHELRTWGGDGRSGALRDLTLVRGVDARDVAPLAVAVLRGDRRTEACVVIVREMASLHIRSASACVYSQWGGRTHRGVVCAEEVVGVFARHGRVRALDRACGGILRRVTELEAQLVRRRARRV
jgi:hypothetical protein